MNQKYPDVRFPGWEVVRKLGQGSFGGVYEIQRTLPDGRVERGALKKLSVPHDREEIEEMLSKSFSTESITAHYKDQMGDLVREYSLMQELGSCGNVVTCHDIQYVQQEGGLGWDVYIRMELLRPLKKALGQEYREETVLKLGLDLCNALKACQKKNIIHRDIKPENILVSDDGTFKLTDFGIAKVSEKTGSGTLTGTIGYMAPEVANRQHYGASADQYSLGMVLYWMMNKRTLPFLPLPPEIPTANQRQEATNRRFNGEPLPPPVHGSPELKQIVQKACAFSAADRYQSIQEFSAALEACCDVKTAETVVETVRLTKTSFTEKATSVAANEEDEDALLGKKPPSDTQPEMIQETLTKPKKSPAKQKIQNAGKLKTESSRNATQKNRKIVFVAAAAVAVVLGGIFWGIVKLARDYKKVMDAGQYKQAQTAFEAPGDYQDSEELAQEAREKQQQVTSIAAGRNHTVGLRRDGTVVAVGYNGGVKCDVSDWRDIEAVAAGGLHTVGLRSDGTVEAVGYNEDGQCDVSGWRDIVAVAAGGLHTVGLRSDGTVVAVGYNEDGRCDVSSWSDIVAVDAGSRHTIGLRRDGTVVAVGGNSYGECDVSGWRDIVAVDAGSGHTVGLCSDGTVVAVGKNEHGQCDVSGWANIRTLYWDAGADFGEAGATKSATIPSQKLQPGQTVTMGHYPKVSDSITWQILDVQSDQALLIAQKGLDVQPYHTKYGSVTWETSSLRDWLNTTFLNGAFTAEEQTAIRTTYVDNGKAQGCDLWDTDGGNNTQDKVFLLSYGEAKKYFDIATPGIDGPEKARIQPTKYAEDQGAYVSEEFETADGKDATRWWLRSPGCNQLDAACVHARGCIGEQMCSNKDTCVRPAMWVDLNQIK